MLNRNEPLHSGLIGQGGPYPRGRGACTFVPRHRADAGPRCRPESNRCRDPTARPLRTPAPGEDPPALAGVRWRSSRLSWEGGRCRRRGPDVRPDRAGPVRGDGLLDGIHYGRGRDPGRAAGGVSAHPPGQPRAVPDADAPERPPGIAFDDSEEGDTGQAGSRDDPWHNWTIEIYADGRAEFESRQRSVDTRYGVYVDRVTADWKIQFRPFFNYDYVRFERDDETIASTSRRDGVTSYVVRSLTPHWSVGGFGDAFHVDVRQRGRSLTGLPEAEVRARAWEMVGGDRP